METKNVVELRVPEPSALRAWWLDGPRNAGVFVPGDVDLAAGAAVRVCVVLESIPAGNVVLPGIVVQRRTTAGSSLPPPAMKGASLPPVAPLRPGLGIAFDDEGALRSRYLARLARGEADERREGLRWPLSLAAHVVLGEGERPVRIVVTDVGTRGASISTTTRIGARVDLRVTLAIRSVEHDVTSAFAGRVVWSDDRGFGVQFELDSREDRARWAKLVTRSREAFERQMIARVRL